MISWGNLFLPNTMIFIVISSNNIQLIFLAPNNNGGDAGIRENGGGWLISMVDGWYRWLMVGVDVDGVDGVDVADHLSVFSNDHIQHP